jgi:Tfp pilus assembly protein PilF
MTLCNKGVCERRMGKLTSSLDSLMQSLKLTKSTNEKTHLNNVYLNLAVLNS